MPTRSILYVLHCTVQMDIGLIQEKKFQGWVSILLMACLVFRVTLGEVNCNFLAIAHCPTDFCTFVLEPDLNATRGHVESKSKLHSGHMRWHRIDQELFFENVQLSGRRSLTLLAEGKRWILFGLNSHLKDKRKRKSKKRLVIRDR